MPIFTLTFGGFTLSPTWYGLMYALSFYVFFLVMKRQKMPEKEIDILLLFTIIGVVLGGRIGYIVFYNFSYYQENLLDILKLWQGGMSFHGGAIGVILAWLFAARKMKVPFLELSDKLVWIVPFGLLLGRIGNYINAELFGLPGYRGFGARIIEDVSYFPTPLLEGLLEGIILGYILYLKRKSIAYPGQLGVWFLGGYSVFRFIAEFFRTPDIQIGYIIGEWMTMGHVLSIAMLIIAIGLHAFLKNKKS